MRSAVDGESFHRLLQRLSQAGNVFYPFAFADWRDMRDFSRKKEELQALFGLLAVEGRVDAHEFIAAAQAAAKGSFDEFLRYCALNHCFAEPGRLLREEFCYFADCFFRAAARLLGAVSQAGEQPWRLDAEELEAASLALFPVGALRPEEFRAAVAGSREGVALALKALWAALNGGE